MEDKLKQYLVDWIFTYLKNRDIVFKKIAEIKKEEGKVITKLKEDKEQLYIVEPFVENVEETLKKFGSEENSTLVVYNTKENFDKVLNSWEKLINFKKHFNIYFVNPFSKLEKKWIVYPYTHHSISGGESKLGLKTLFETVEPITRQELEKTLK